MNIKKEKYEKKRKENETQILPIGISEYSTNVNFSCCSIDNGDFDFSWTKANKHNHTTRLCSLQKRNYISFSFLPKQKIVLGYKKMQESKSGYTKMQ